jgi:hypothetical protein
VGGATAGSGLVDDAVACRLVDHHDDARVLFAGPLLDADDLRSLARNLHARARARSRCGEGPLPRKALFNRLEDARRRPIRRERGEAPLDPSEACAARSRPRRRGGEAALRAIELRVGRRGVARGLARQERPLERGVAGAGNGDIFGRCAEQVDRFFRVLFPPLDAPDARHQPTGKGVQLDCARPGAFFDRARLHRLSEGDQLRARWKRLAGRKEGLGPRQLHGIKSAGIDGAFAPTARGERQKPNNAQPTAAILGIGEESHVRESTSAPTYADRASGQVFPDARTMVNAYLSRFAERAGSHLEPLDEQGYTQIRKGSASIGINVLEDHGVLLFLAPIMRVPHTGRETFYRRLLELSFLTTADASFSIDSQKDEVFVRSLRRLSGLDYEEFEDLLDTVGKVADEWDDVLRKEFAQS